LVYNNLAHKLDNPTQFYKSIAILIEFFDVNGTLRDMFLPEEVPTQRDGALSLTLGKVMCALPWNSLGHRLCFTRYGKLNKGEGLK
jgi:hypothetical protein